MLYTADDLYKAERSFASESGRDHALGILRDVRNVQEKSLPDIPHKMAAWIVAPVIAGFAAFVAEQEGKPLMLGVMREGRLLCGLMNSLFGVQAKEIWLNRNLSMLAAFGCGDDEALVNWLVRTRNKPTTYTEAFGKLTGENTGGNKLVDLAGAYDLLQDKSHAPLLAKARRRAGALADRLVKHLQKTAAGHNTVCLMDFACAGNIQRSLETVLKAKNIPLSVTGLNFAMTAGSVWAKRKGCIMRGYLAQAGQPSWFAQAYAKSPEVMEVFTAPPLGSLEDYTEGGDPIYGRSFLTSAQQSLALDMQRHILVAASAYHREFKGRISADIIRCIWGRLLLKPMSQELASFKDWPLDAGIDGTAQRKLVAKDGWVKR